MNSETGVFKFSGGPWAKIFDGAIEGQSIEIYSNEKSMVLVLVYETENNKPVGVVLELFKVFSCAGEIEAFLESLPKDAFVFLKHNEKRTFKFLVLGSSPAYSIFEEEAVLDEFDGILKKVNSSAQMLSDISKAYDLTITEISKASDMEKQAFFAEPLSMQMLSHAAMSPEEKAALQPAAMPAGELLLGITKEGGIAKEPLDFFAKTLITGPNEKYRLHTTHIIVEGALLSSLAVVIIDWKNNFRGISEPTKDLSGLKKFMVNFEPIGFPVAHFNVPENVKVELETVDMLGLLEMFGAGDNAATRTAMQKNSLKKHRSIAELVETLKKSAPTEETTAYQINKAIRILSLFELHYPCLLDGENNFDEIAKSWMKGLGRAGIIHLENKDERTCILVIHSVIRGLVEHFKRQGVTNRLRAMVIMPEAKKILPAITSNSISRTIASEMIELAAYGVGFAVSAEKSSEMDQKIMENIEAEISIIEKNDVGIKIKNRKNYRALLRPGFSACTELQ